MGIWNKVKRIFAWVDVEEEREREEREKRKRTVEWYRARYGYDFEDDIVERIEKERKRFIEKFGTTENEVYIEKLYLPAFFSTQEGALENGFYDVYKKTEMMRRDWENGVIDFCEFQELAGSVFKEYVKWIREQRWREEVRKWKEEERRCMESW